MTVLAPLTGAAFAQESVEDILKSIGEDDRPAQADDAPVPLESEARQDMDLITEQSEKEIENLQAQQPDETTSEDEFAYKGLEEEYPESYIREAEKFRAYCEGRPTMNDHYNCECLSYEYLKVRDQVGPRVHGTSIISRIDGLCLDATGAAGTMFTQCLGIDAASIPDDLDSPMVNYCKCFANAYAKLYTDYKMPPSSESSIRFLTMAKTSCRDPVRDGPTAAIGMKRR